MKRSIMKLAVPVLGLPRAAKRCIALSVDLGICVLTVWLAYYLRLGEFSPLTGAALWSVWISIGIAIPIFILSGLYRAIFRYSGWPALLAVSRAVFVYGLIYSSIFTAIGVPGVPRTIGIIQPILMLIFIGMSRALARIWLGDEYRSILKSVSQPRVLIYGAGASGRQLAAAITNSREIRLVGFLDDDVRLQGNTLNGQRVYKPSELDILVNTLNISDILLAMPNLPRWRRNQILANMERAHVAVRTLPNLNDIAKGRVSLSDIRDLDIDDLLGRDPVVPEEALLSKTISNKVIIVTGAGGSIGSELCRQIAGLNPAKLLLIEQNEYALYTIHQELEETLANLSNNRRPILVPILSSVQDYTQIQDIMTIWRPDTVYHAAAYKHVPLVEQNPGAGILNNVFGTLRTAQAALESGVTNFVLISTDKAVRPTNVMGASKRLAEIILQALSAQHTTTHFSIVRFGNVLGSSGSVVPKFRKQIRDGGPITLTHQDIIRYFMTIPEAAQLVLQAGAMSSGGDVFLLDMGEPVKIFDLARRMVELSGLTIRDDENPDGDIEIEITGLRPGEKLYEELLIGKHSETTAHPRIWRSQEEFLPWSELEPALKGLESTLHAGETRAALSILRDVVPQYTPDPAIINWPARER